MDILMEVIIVNLVVMVFDQVFIGLTGGSTEANIGTQGSNPCPSEEYSSAIAPPGRDENLGSTAPRDSAIAWAKPFLQSVSSTSSTG
jgi:hypothetical protein